MVTKGHGVPSTTRWRLLGLVEPLLGELIVNPHNLRTVVVLAASSALVIATSAPSVAQEVPPAGTGSSSGEVSVLTLDLGTDALGLRLLGEDSLTSNNPAAGVPSALERVSLLQVTSDLLPALDALSQATVETSSTSGEDTTSTPAIDLGALVTGAPVPGLLTGIIDPVALRSAVDANGAVSSAAGTIRDLTVFGGLLTMGTASAQLGSSALVTDAGSVRGLQLESVEVLDLTALLDLLGISLADLPIDVAVGLLDQLGLPLPDGLSPEDLLVVIDGLLADTSVVRDQVTVLQGQIDALQVELTTLTSELAGADALLAECIAVNPALCGLIQALVDSLNAEIAVVQADIDDLQTQIDALLVTISAALDELLGLLDSVLAGLDGATLLVVEDLVVGLTARADNTLDTSVASVVGSVGDVRIGGLSLGGLDVGSTPAQLTALADQVTATLSGILSTIDPSLANLVDIDLLTQATSLTEDAGVVEALAAITGLRATVTPPAVCDLLEGLGGATDSLGAVLGGLGEVLSSLPGPVGEVLGDLGSAVDCTAEIGSVATALTQPVTVQALSVSGAATFSSTGAAITPQTPTTPGSLPGTGGNAQLALVAVGLGAVGLAARRLLARCS